jgi:hypothetical protein
LYGLALPTAGCSGVRIIKPPCGSALLTTIKSVASAVSLLRSSSEKISGCLICGHGENAEAPIENIAGGDPNIA